MHHLRRGRFVATLATVSFSSLSKNHGNLLVIDAASEVLQVGWIEPNVSPCWIKLSSEAGTGLYQALAELAVSPNDAACFVFCEGPGSMLGIRTIATALRTWTALRPRSVYSYLSLELAAYALGKPGATLIADARRQSWHTLTLDQGGKPSEIQRLPTEDLPAGSVYTLAGVRSWTKLPQPAPQEVPYDASVLTTDLANEPLLRKTDDPDAFQPERPTYAQWTPRVHQSPSP